MPMVMGMMFGAFGLLAAGTILLAARRIAATFGSLRAALREPPATIEIRTSLREQVLIRQHPNRGPLRHRHRAKPITHRLRLRHAA